MMLHKATVIDDPEFHKRQHRKPLIVDVRALRPLPPAMWDMACTWCDKRQSRWEFFQGPDSLRARKGEPVCAHCWIYKSDWAQQNLEGVRGFIHDIEVARAQIFARSEGGMLAQCADADRILGAIAVTSRVFEYRRMVGAWETDDGT